MEFVTVADGVRLHVESHGPSDPTVTVPRATVVLVHGWTLSNQTWTKVIPHLEDVGDVRIVTYDHRGHGKSDPVTEGAGSIEQMARDLTVVLEKICPEGPVVLVGHSLGGMTLLALVDQEPELVGERVVGLVLVNTSAGGRKGVNNGIPLGQTNWGRALVRRGLTIDAKRRTSPKRIDKAQDRPGRPRTALMKWLLCGKDAAPQDVALGMKMVHDTPPGSFPAFLNTFLEHNRLAALDHLQDLPVTILSGAKDRLTPPAESVEMSRRIPHARLRVFPLAGHMLPLERAQEVSAEIIEMLNRIPVAAGHEIASGHGVKS